MSSLYTYPILDLVTRSIKRQHSSPVLWRLCSPNGTHWGFGTRYGWSPPNNEQSEPLTREQGRESLPSSVSVALIILLIPCKGLGLSIFSCQEFSLMCIFVLPAVVILESQSDNASSMITKRAFVSTELFQPVVPLNWILDRHGKDYND